MKETMSFNGAQLKWFAIICMLIDHIGAVLVDQTTSDYVLLRSIGRIAFPIFAFLLVEGFTHTRNRLKYVRNLCLFALISEVPFDLAITNMAIHFGYQNVFCTLAFGLIAIWAMEYVTVKGTEKNLKDGMVTFLTIIPAVAFALCAEYLQTDYGAIGVLAICIFYKYRQKRAVGATIVWIMLSLFNLSELFCFPMIVAIKYYNGERGKQYKYLFYVFYPVHLLLLVAIRNFILV